MSLEADLAAVLGAQCSGRVYPDTAPHDTARPYITYQRVGGQVINPVSNSDPGLHNARVQVNVWHDTRAAANALMRSVAAALRAAPLLGVPEGAAADRADDLNLLRGCQQDFSVWHAE